MARQLTVEEKLELLKQAPEYLVSKNDNGERGDLRDLEIFRAAAARLSKNPEKHYCAYVESTIFPNINLDSIGKLIINNLNDDELDELCGHYRA